MLMFTMDTLGRKIMLIFNLALAGFAMVAVAIIGLVDDPDDPSNQNLILFFFQIV